MSREVKSKKEVLIAAAGALIIILILDLTPLGGNIMLYGKAVQCGGSIPYKNDFLVTGEVPHYVKATGPGLLMGIPAYFCTPEDAERAGYSANAQGYEFPHLKTQDEKASAYSKAQRILSE